jgi:hypothetical protein
MVIEEAVISRSGFDGTLMFADRAPLFFEGAPY